MPGPTNIEQELLELVNETRLSPLQNAARYISSYSPLTSSNADIQNALTFFGVNGTALLSAYQALTPVQPLAWNESLATAARNHSSLMLSTNTQDHVLPGEADIGVRIAAAGYLWNGGSGGGYGENIYAYSESALHAHAGFMVDWGFGPNGMQSPAGHRDNIMDGSLREIGVGIVADSSTTNNVGPLLVTEDLGVRNGSGAFLLGVAYNDTNANGIYTAGEGLGTLVTTLGSTSVTSFASGGYTINTTLTGARTVTFTGAGLASAVSAIVTLTSSSNIKLDIVNGNTLRSSASVNVSGPIATIIGLGVTGLDLRASGANAHTFFGTAGADSMTGGTGGDTYNVGAGDTISEAQGGGSDVVQSSSISLNLANYSNVEVASLSGTLALSATGTAAANVLSGSGNSAANVLSGLGGNDTYIVGAGDTISELSGGGSDRVQSSLINLNLASYANVENITLTGSAARSATGNAVANLIDGASNSAANTLTGLQGNDTYIVGAGDTVVETSTGGTADTVQSSLISLRLTSFANVENARLTGSASLSLTGNQGNNLLVGNAGNNYIAGGAGLDTLTGGGGLNFYLFNTALSATNVDTITDFLAATDTIRLENSIFTAFAGVANNATIDTGNLRAGLGVTTAADPNDFLIYNTSTGDLFYDADGSLGGSSAVKFATLSNHASLSRTDFVIV